MTSFLSAPRALVIAALAQCLSLTAAGNAMADPTQRTLHSFCSADACTDGLTPYSGITSDSAGNLYGVVEQNGGSLDHGLAYALKKQGTKYKFIVAHRFCQDGCSDGDGPTGALITDVDGNVYGVTSNAGVNGGGTVFKLQPNKNKTKWKLKTLYSFCTGCASGSMPVAGLTYQGAQTGQPYDGTSPLYGVALYGGAKNGGVAFQLAFNGKQATYTVLHDFCLDETCADGMQPESPLVMDSDGNLFGTTRSGGNGGGTVFEVSPSEAGYKTTTLHQFCQKADCTDGTFPRGALNIDGSGNILGATVEGGANGMGTGTIFSLSPRHHSWIYKVVHNFCSAANCVDGGQPQGAVLDSNGDLVGVTTYGGEHSNSGQGGTVFKLHGKSLTTLYSFCAKKVCADGSNPVGGVALDAAGDVFGVTNGGGQHFDGSVFELTP